MRSLPLMGFYLLTRLGHEAVIVFFVLSGFLVGGNVLKKIQGGDFCVQKFAIDRGCRILLPLFGSLLFIGFTDVIFGNIKSIWTYLGNLFSLQGIAVPSVSGPFWSLNYEVWFYVICGAFGFLMIVKSDKPNKSFWCWGIIFICGLLYAFLKPVYLIIFGIGASISIIDFGKRYRWRLSILAVAGIVGSIVLMQYTTPSKSFTAIDMKFYQVAEVLLAGAVALLIKIISEIQVNGRWQTLYMQFDRLGSVLAAFSYTLYLSHYQVMKILSSHYNWKCSEPSGEGFLYLFGGIIISAFVAFVLYFLFERNTKALKNICYAKFKLIVPESM